MAVKIRLSRRGSKRNPHYKIVAADSRAKRDGKFIEIIGHYHPRETELAKKIILESDRFQYFIGTGAIPTERVVKLALLLNLEVPQKFMPLKISKFNGMSKKEVKVHLKDMEEADKKKKEELKAAKEAEEAKTEESSEETKS